MIDQLGMKPKRTAYRSPWQNGTAERWIGTVRRELLDPVIVIDERHLLRLLREYVEYYNAERVHTCVRDSPSGRPIEHRPSPPRPSHRIASRWRSSSPVCVARSGVITAS